MMISVRSNDNFCVFIRLLLAFIFFCSTSYGQEHILDNKIHHLRNSDEIEWESFSNKDVKKALVIHFQSQPNTSEKALYLRQSNVKQPWHILVNKNKIGLLFVDENDIYSYYKIPEGLLTQGENILEIESENTIPDDILISEIKLNDQSVNKVLSEAFL